MCPQRLEVRVSGYKHTKILCVTIAYQWYDARVCNIDIARAVHFQIRVDDTSLVSRKHGGWSCRIKRELWNPQKLLVPYVMIL